VRVVLWPAVVLIAAGAIGLYGWRVAPARMTVRLVPRGGEPFGPDPADAKRQVPCGGQFQLGLRPSRDAYALVYLINTGGVAQELWPPIGEPWPRLAAGQTALVPGAANWFQLGSRPGNGAVIVAWARKPMLARRSVWIQICRTLESGTEPTERRVEAVRRLVADIADGTVIVPFEQQ
jgi:hypothetical protein